MRKIISFPIIALFVICSLQFSNVNGQDLSSEDIKKQLAIDWQRAKDYTVEYLNTMPANKYSSKAVDSLRSFSNQMLHLATANVFLMANATNGKPLPWASFGLEKSPTAQNKDSVMYYVTASYDYCMNAVKNTDTKKWGEKTSLFGFETTRFAMMQKTFEHQTHHRGQTTIYIRLQNIKPPQERLF